MEVAKILRQIRRNLAPNLSINSLVHVGANIGQEAAGYEAAGFESYLIEAMPKEFEQLHANCTGLPNQHAINACCDTRAGITVEFNVTSNSQSSSLLDLGRHSVAYPNVKLVKKIELKTTTLDRLAAEGRITPTPSLLVLDVQGAEGRVLEGAAAVLKSPNLWGVISEVSLDPLYKDGTSFEELYSTHLLPNGFFLKSANFGRMGWTNALFLKRWWKLAGENQSPLERHTASPQR